MFVTLRAGGNSFRRETFRNPIREEYPVIRHSAAFPFSLRSCSISLRAWTPPSCYQTSFYRIVLGTKSSDFFRSAGYNYEK